MTGPVERVYRCPDGRDFPVIWPTADDAMWTWWWDPEHNPAPATPMDAATWQECTAGAARARVECGFSPTDTFIGSPATRYINGFRFTRSLPPRLSDRRLARTANDRLREEYGTAAAFWERWCVPRTRAAFEVLRGGADRPVADLLEVFGYGFEQTFLMWGVEDDGLHEFLRAEMGDEGDRLAAELRRGHATATLDADQALWELAQVAAATPPLRKALMARAPTRDLPSVEGGAAFMAGFERYLDTFGWRTVGWDVSTPTVAERPEALLDVVRRTLAEGLRSPSDRVAIAARGREHLAEAVGRRFATNPTKAAEFRRRFEAAGRYVGVKEGRALWQLSLCGALRHALLARGRELSGTGALERAEDIFFLQPAEVDELLAQEATPGSPLVSAGQRVAVRRADRDRWLGVVPPAQVGREVRPGSPASAGANELRGIAGSSGRATGKARIIASIEEYERLGSGEVLVCATTTPAWSPLLAVAGAVIASGDAYSHTAVAAREYGIPAVVGLPAATSLIADGQLVTVDGDAGVVRLVAG